MQKIVVIYQILQELWWVPLLGPTALWIAFQLFSALYSLKLTRLR